MGAPDERATYRSRSIGCTATTLRRDPGICLAPGRSATFRPAMATDPPADLLLDRRYQDYVVGIDGLLETPAEETA